MPIELKIAIFRLETIRNTHDSILGEICDTIIDITYALAETKKEIGFKNEERPSKR